MDELGYPYTGGKNAPYVWIDGGMDSWQFFDMLLSKTGVVCTPGAGFGKCGQPYIRLSAFNSRERVAEAMSRLKNALR
jgi:LL-diaminopimelate aminotransferase